MISNIKNNINSWQSPQMLMATDRLLTSCKDSPLRNKKSGPDNDVFQGILKLIC